MSRTSAAIPVLTVVETIEGTSPHVDKISQYQKFIKMQFVILELTGKY